VATNSASRTAITPSRTTSTRTTSTPSLLSRGATSSNSSSSYSTRTVSSRSTGTISERSTLSSFRGTSPSFRGNSTQPNESLPTYTTRSTYTPTSYYYGTYYPTYYPTYTPYYYGGYSIGFSFSTGSFYFGTGYHYPYWGYTGFGWYNPWVHYGTHSVAVLVGTAWHIYAYNTGWLGYNFGYRSYYWPWGTWRRCHRYSYHGTYCRVRRPYWYGYSRWYDYSPYGYGYTSLTYDSLYDDGYDDGYDRGYNRGYENGAEDASAYRDDRRRDQIGTKPRPRVPDSSIDRAKTDAAEEYRYEMNRGTESFTNGDFKTATRAYKEALILNPDSADARYSLAISAFAEGKYAFSAFALRRGIALEPKSSNIDLQKVFGDPVKFQEFNERLDKELTENPEDPDLLLLSGYVALRTGDASAAAQKLDHALEVAPQDNAAKVLHREALDALEDK